MHVRVWYGVFWLWSLKYNPQIVFGFSIIRAGLYVIYNFLFHTQWSENSVGPSRTFKSGFPSLMAVVFRSIVWDNPAHPSLRNLSNRYSVIKVPKTNTEWTEKCRHMRWNSPKHRDATLKHPTHTHTHRDLLSCSMRLIPSHYGVKFRKRLL